MSDTAFSFHIGYTIRDDAKETENWASESGLSYDEMIDACEEEIRAGRTKTMSGNSWIEVVKELRRREARHARVRRWVIGTLTGIAIIALVIVSQLVAHSVAAGL